MYRILLSFGRIISRGETSSILSSFGAFNFEGRRGGEGRLVAGGRIRKRASCNFSSPLPFAPRRRCSGRKVMVPVISVLCVGPWSCTTSNWLVIPPRAITRSNFSLSLSLFRDPLFASLEPRSRIFPLLLLERRGKKAYLPRGFFTREVIFVSIDEREGEREISFSFPTIRANFISAYSRDAKSPF